MPTRGRSDHVEQDKGQEKWAAFLLRAGQAPKDQAVGDGDKLHQQQRQDQLGGAKAQLGAVDGRHADDRADAVVVDQEGNQVFEQLAVAADMRTAFRRCA